MGSLKKKLKIWSDTAEEKISQDMLTSLTSKEKPSSHFSSLYLFLCSTTAFWKTFPAHHTGMPAHCWPFPVQIPESHRRERPARITGSHFFQTPCWSHHLEQSCMQMDLEHLILQQASTTSKLTRPAAETPCNRVTLSCQFKDSILYHTSKPASHQERPVTIVSPELYPTPY